MVFIRANLAADCPMQLALPKFVRDQTQFVEHDASMRWTPDALNIVLLPLSVGLDVKSRHGLSNNGGSFVGPRAITLCR